MCMVGLESIGDTQNGRARGIARGDGTVCSTTIKLETSPVNSSEMTPRLSAGASHRILANMWNANWTRAPMFSLVEVLRSYRRDEIRLLDALWD
ncbi:hypothetical protein EVAR_43791_1 [Eumeta japonica]|uniref:Uncharacterized protein n=1 Tax=Eumeta variegata TaxID=151549 RepID=A0A4C1XVY0_EUMVA|nr:hypothetical protein EVAR_43791_1 [Eumeta japonica]